MTATRWEAVVTTVATSGDGGNPRRTHNTLAFLAAHPPPYPSLPLPHSADNPGGFCPRTSSLLPGEVQTNVNGFLPGAGKLTFPVQAGSQTAADPNQPMFLSVFGVCRGTGNSFAMLCCSTTDAQGHCPGTGTPGAPSGGSLLYVPNGTGCTVRGNTIVGGNTATDGACKQCSLN